MPEAKTAAPADAVAVDMIPNPMGLDPNRMKYDSQEVALAGKHFVWLRVFPMVMPVGTKIVVTLPDGTRLDWQG